jgi:hypothetical protein
LRPRGMKGGKILVHPEAGLPTRDRPLRDGPRDVLRETLGADPLASHGVKDPVERPHSRIIGQSERTTLFRSPRPRVSPASSSVPACAASKFGRLSAVRTFVGHEFIAVHREEFIPGLPLRRSATNLGPRAAAQQPDDEQHDGDDQEYMDERPNRVRPDDSEQPGDQENDGYGIQHCDLSLQMRGHLARRRWTILRTPACSIRGRLSVRLRTSAQHRRVSTRARNGIQALPSRRRT